MRTLESFRTEIDALDAQLVATLSRRFDVVRRVGRFKKQHGVPMMQPARIEAVKERCLRLAAQHGVDGDLIAAIYDLIVQESCQIEVEIIEGSETALNCEITQSSNE